MVCGFKAEPFGNEDTPKVTLNISMRTMGILDGVGFRCQLLLSERTMYGVVKLLATLLGPLYTIFQDERRKKLIILLTTLM